MGKTMGELTSWAWVGGSLCVRRSWPPVLGMLVIMVQRLAGRTAFAFYQ